MIFESAIIYILHISPPIGIELLATNTNASVSVIVQVFKYAII